MKPKQNPVAKYARRVNRASVHRDKTKYNRKRLKSQIPRESFLLYVQSILV
jgi:hypothetical protein